MQFIAYHWLLAFLGLGIVLAHWIPSALSRIAFSASPLIMITGLISYFLLADWPPAASPLAFPELWERGAEIVVIIVLFTTGLRIDRMSGWRRWSPTVRLLAIAMPLTIFAIAFLGWALAGMTIAGAIMLGAVLAPTDPVLAGDVQVGAPGQGKEDPIRFTLTAEAGLNDGLAFPFVYLALVVATKGADPATWFSQWIIQDVIYRIAMGFVCGVGTGWILGRVSFLVIQKRSLALSAPGVIALGGTFLCYGVTEILHGYGFIAVFVAGLIYRRSDAEHNIHGRLHSFSVSIEQAFSSVLLFFIGASLPSLWQYIEWWHTVIGFSIIIIIRPALGMLSLVKSSLSYNERMTVAFLGVRGIGSIYYLAYASAKMEFVNNNELWALVCYTIFASAVIHGLSAKWLVNRSQNEVPTGKKT